MFLIDENISFKVAKLISEAYPGIVHVRDIGLTNVSDLQIWEYAKTNNLSIITFDNDFLNISLLKGYPPKIILLKVGNRSTKEIASILISQQEIIGEFLNEPSFKSLACLEIS